ncbi:MAG: transposase [Clostridia bacterium]|nr:transposase [Clostridia bacterium]
MSRLSRNYSESGVYHILFRGVNQQNIFEEKQDYIKLLETIDNVKKDMHFELYAYCFMSNHVHLVIKEAEIKDISLIMKRILTKYARWYNIKYKRSGALIANRYKSVPVELDEYFLHLIRYVHQNPLKAGIVENIENYPYSSYNEYLLGAVITNTEFVLGMLNLPEFVEFHSLMENMNFIVSDRKKKTDEALVFKINNTFHIQNPKDIAKLDKLQRNEIIKILKQEFPARQIQRITNVSRGVIAKL